MPRRGPAASCSRHGATRAAAAALILLAGCATESPDGPRADASASAAIDASPAAGSDASQGGSVDGGAHADDGGADSGDDTAYCYAQCERASDCAVAGAGSLHDEDNYACEDGACVWTGCNDSSECEELAGDYTCTTRGAATVPTCYQTCEGPEDCAQAGAVFDADNYRCDEGACVWTGCNDSAECEEDRGDGYVCAGGDGQVPPSCVRRCDEPADCVEEAGGPLYDEDNYACERGACVWTGCNDSAECEAASAEQDMTCRPTP